MLYFAYGSNLNWEQMRSRCPSAAFISVAMLPNHRLAFTRKSKKRNCGVADALAEKGRHIWGVIYEIGEHETGQLDEAEGYRPGRARNAYVRQERQVHVDGNPDKPMCVAIYFAEQEPAPPLPSQAYKDLIVSGARHWGLPADYLGSVLERIEVAP